MGKDKNKSNTPDPDLNSCVGKSNDVIVKMGKFKLSELRLIAYCLAHYDSREGTNEAYTATVAGLQEIFNINKSNAYEMVKDAVISLGSKPLQFKEGNARHLWHWFAGFVYYEKEGRFVFKIHPELEPKLLGLRGSFTKYRLKDVYQFRRAVSWKLYELLKRWDTRGYWEVEIEPFRALLGFENTRIRWDNLKRQIDIAIKDINTTSDLEVILIKKKTVRTITSLYFKISQKQQLLDEAGNTVNLETDRQKIEFLLCEVGIHQKTINTYLEKIAETGKESLILSKLPSIINRANKRPKEKKQYVIGAIKGELQQTNLFGLDNSTKAKYYRDAVECFERKGKQCLRKTNSPRTCKFCVEQVYGDKIGKKREPEQASNKELL